MKGLDLCERYFKAYGYSLLGRSPELMTNRIAAGLVGPGSDCLGFDDDISRDHDWGPGFCLWLTDEDFDTYGAQLTESYNSLPPLFEGFRRATSDWGDGRVGVFKTSAFYRRYLGVDCAPATVQEWLAVPENNLAVVTSGRVFVDPLDKFSSIRRRLLEFYPDDIQRIKIAARCMSAGQSGQYNASRCHTRGDALASQFSLVKFCCDILNIVFLLNRCYSPYFKWQLRASRNLPLLGQSVSNFVELLLRANELKQKQTIIDEIARSVIEVFLEKRLSDIRSPFLLDHGQRIQEMIGTPELKTVNLWSV